MNHGPENTRDENTRDADAGGRGEAAAATPAGAGATAGDPEGTADDGADPAAGNDGTGATDGTPNPLFGGGGRGGDDAGTGTGTGTAAASAPGPAADRASSEQAVEEAALRRMLRGAVQDLAPAEGTLDRLHRAVPARRARRRQAAVGAAAAALLIGTAVPAFIHVAGSDGSVTANPAIAGHGEQAQGGSGDERVAEGGTEQTTTGPAQEQSEGSKGEPDSSTAPSQGGEADPGGQETGGIVDSPASEAAAAPDCDPKQLGVRSAESGAAGADGTVYGSFRIANVSGKDCSVTSNGTVGFETDGAADPHKITVVQHTAGDAAAGLPDPSLEPGTVLLKPTMTYEVKFAWVPTDTCPTTGSSPSPTPTDAVGGGSTGSGAAAEGAGPQFGSADEGPADGSVAVTLTPETGAATAETKIVNACAGTIYRTGVLVPS